MRDAYHIGALQSKQEMLKMRWKQHEEEGLQFFQNFQINRDGGFKDVPELFLPLRFVFAMVGFFAAASNVGFLLFRNVPMIFRPWYQHHLGASGRLYATNIIVIPILQSIGLFPDEYLKGTVAVAFLEVALLAWFVAKLLKHLIRVKMEGSGVIMWHSSCVIAWNILPTLSVLSALQVLYWVHPQVLARNLKHAMFQAKMDGRYFKVVKLCCVSLCAGVFGFDAFMAKFHRMIEIEKTNSPNLMIVIEFLVFLNQILGVVQIEWSMRVRLHQFMFAGPDAAMTVGEEVESAVWQAMLAHHIWLEAQHKPAPRAWFYAVMCSHTENDLQLLMLGDEDDADEKSEASKVCRRSSGKRRSNSGGAGGMVELQNLHKDGSSTDEQEAF
eukprot:TRINITY_DN56574_c0_g1_i1.p1 TRINITY_DN56574_c0_g1~~TRINITY_DN56574_c0_g1_i1.p1  ORF type:complete len:384 (+),score=47.30 TRINITY_DN56574_c0_g1_i1:348-1499(+)